MVKIEDLPTEIPPGTYRILLQFAQGTIGSGLPARWVWLLANQEGQIGLYTVDAGIGDWETKVLTIS